MRISDWSSDVCSSDLEKGVVWHVGRKVVAIHTAGSGIRADLDDGSVIEADAVLTAVGLRPHTRLAEEAGLAIGRGIKVDATGRTSDPHIYAIDRKSTRLNSSP